MKETTNILKKNKGVYEKPYRYLEKEQRYI